MPAMKLLIPNRTVQIESTVGQILGLGFSVAGPAANQEIQRWLMFTRDLGRDSFPRNPVRIRPTDLPGWREITQLDGDTGFLKKARDTYIQGRDLYIVANCLSVQGTPIPDVPVPAFLPSDPGGDSQGFWGMAPLSLDTAPAVGVVYVESVTTLTRLEYWALYDSYRAPDTGVQVEIGKENALGGGDAFARIIEGSRWTSHTTPTLVSCACAMWDEAFPE